MFLKLLHNTMFSEHFIRTDVLAPETERTDCLMKKEYISEIKNLLPFADEELLDFVFQLLCKSVEKPLTPLGERPQSV